MAVHLPHTYDAAGRPLATTDTLAGTILFSQTDTLDAAGQRIAIADSWGHSAFGYDPAGRLVGASYPDGSTELDQYDGVGNRTVITSTVTLSGTSSISTTVTTNQYDAADELAGSTAQTVGVQGPPQPTTYSYDANGNQLGSTGPSGAITNTYDLRNELVGWSTPAPMSPTSTTARATGCARTTPPACNRCCTTTRRTWRPA